MASSTGDFGELRRPLTRRFAPPSPAKGRGLTRGNIGAQYFSEDLQLVCPLPWRERAECVSIPGEGGKRHYAAHAYLQKFSSLILFLAIFYGLAMQPAHASGLGYDGPPAQEICALCHSLDGISPMSKFPRLAGQKAGYIEKQLADFLAGERSNDGGQMSAIVTEIEPEQFKDAAAYFAALPPPPPITPENGGEPDPAAKNLVEQGDPRRAIPACASCHMPELADAPLPESADAPHLTSQHADYIAKQLHDFRSGDRANDGAGVMTAIAKALGDGEIDALALYLASMPRTGSHDR